MRLERDEFVITYDETKATPQLLLATIRQAGYTAQVVTGKNNGSAAKTMPAELPPGFALLDEAIQQAQRERKPIVLDFFAAWCAPCQRMEKTTFADPKVKELLARCVLVRIDVDQHEELARQLGVVGLPDLRLITPDGKLLRQLRGYQFPDRFAAELVRLLQSTAQ
jgi:thiol:disulfide interchange protein